MMMMRLAGRELARFCSSAPKRGRFESATVFLLLLAVSLHRVATREIYIQAKVDCWLDSCPILVSFLSFSEQLEKNKTNPCVCSVRNRSVRQAAMMSVSSYISYILIFKLTQEKRPSFSSAIYDVEHDGDGARAYRINFYYF